MSGVSSIAFSLDFHLRIKAIGEMVSQIPLSSSGKGVLFMRLLSNYLLIIVCLKIILFVQ